MPASSSTARQGRSPSISGSSEASRWLLCGWDKGLGGRWGDVPWVSELPPPSGINPNRISRKVIYDSCEDAFTCLKPSEVAAAEHEGRTIRRQGEWFFVAAPHITDA